MRQVIFATLVAAGVGLASPACAQTTFCLGPQLGGNLSSLHYSNEDFYTTSLRPGLEAGLLATWQLRHWSLQPGVRFSQQGVFVQQGTIDATEASYRLNYLSIPLSIAYTAHPTGQGVQVFAGPYLSMLVGGSYRYHSWFSSTEETGSIRAGGLNATDEYYHTQRLDAGLQAGVGYRFCHLLAQASGSVGLRNLAATTFDPAGNLPGSPYYSRSLRLSIAYLFQLKS